MLQVTQDLQDVRAIPFAGRRFRISPLVGSFLIVVVLPTILAAVYFAFFASKEYVSEAKFVVRASGRAMQQLSQPISTSAGMPTPATSQPASSPLNRTTSRASSSFFFGAPQTVNQDAFIVADYIRSRTILDDMGGKPLMAGLFSRPEIDWWSRLGGDATFEDLRTYWSRKVVVTIDTVSGILTLRVRAFSPEDARKLADLIVVRSESLVNDISERSRNDALHRAEAELEIARKRLVAAQQAVLAFRNRTSMLNPVVQATATGELIALLTKERIAIEGRRNVMSGLSSKDAPTIALLNAQIDEMNKQIAALQAELASPGRASAISGQIAGYEELQLEQQFAETLYSIGKSSYEAARANLERQQLYVLPLARPALPEEVGHPRILLDSIVVFGVFTVLWSMGALLLASIKDHIE